MESLALHVNMEQLLEHREFLTLLARSLVADPVDQEELLWETMGEGATRSTRLHGVGPASLRLWLARVMRNRAIDRHRAALRQERHAPVVARPEAVESAAELAARFELGQDLARHVQALSPDYRDVVLFRFYEALPPREIATRLGVPVESVKTRLQRALTLLRVRLDQEHGSREKWLGSLLPLALPGAKPTGAGISLVGFTTMGAWMMVLKSKALLAGLAALLLLSAGYSWRTSSSPVWEDSELAPPRTEAREPAQSVVKENPVEFTQRDREEISVLERNGRDYAPSTIANGPLRLTYALKMQVLRFQRDARGSMLSLLANWSSKENGEVPASEHAAMRKRISLSDAVIRKVETDDYELVEIGTDRLESSETEIVTSAYSVLIEGKRYLVKVAMDKTYMPMYFSARDESEMLSRSEYKSYIQTFNARPRQEREQMLARRKEIVEELKKLRQARKQSGTKQTKSDLRAAGKLWEELPIPLMYRADYERFLLY